MVIGMVGIAPIFYQIELFVNVGKIYISDKGGAITDAVKTEHYFDGEKWMIVKIRDGDGNDDGDHTQPVRDEAPLS